jgi:hypothetical protein
VEEVPKRTRVKVSNLATLMLKMVKLKKSLSGRPIKAISQQVESQAPQDQWTDLLSREAIASLKQKSCC